MLALAILSLALLIWQWIAARWFPLHRRALDPAYTPGVTLFKPVKAPDETTFDCLRSWLTQHFSGTVQILFGIEAGDTAADQTIARLRREFPRADIEVRVCGEEAGTNPKVSKLMHLESAAKHEILVLSDADVRVPPDLLSNLVPQLRDPRVGLVNCFYRLANPANVAMRLEALAVNADFWSQVLQSRTLAPLDFALGAVIVTRRQHLQDIGGFSALRDCLADDFQLGHRIARLGFRVELSTVVAECWSAVMPAEAVWRHQLRWARTIRVSRPLPYLFSILSNPTFWPLLAAGLKPGPISLGLLGSALLVRVLITWDLEWRLAGPASRVIHPAGALLAPIKDLLQGAIWVLAFLGNKIQWREQSYKLLSDGTLRRVGRG